MGVQPFQIRELFHSGNRFLKRGSVVFHHAGATLELIHRQACKRRARAAGWQRVAGAGHVITKRGGRPRTEEDGARGRDLFPDLGRLFRHHLAVLGRKGVHEVDARGEIAHLDEPAVVLACMYGIIPSFI